MSNEALVSIVIGLAVFAVDRLFVRIPDALLWPLLTASITFVALTLLPEAHRLNPGSIVLTAGGVALLAAAVAMEANAQRGLSAKETGRPAPLPPIASGPPLSSARSEATEHSEEAATSENQLSRKAGEPDPQFTARGPDRSEKQDRHLGHQSGVVVSINQNGGVTAGEIGTVNQANDGD